LFGGEKIVFYRCANVFYTGLRSYASVLRKWDGLISQMTYLKNPFGD